MSSRLSQLLAISVFLSAPIVGNGEAILIPSTHQIFFFYIDFHFLTMEGVPSLIGVLFLPIGLCGLLSL